MRGGSRAEPRDRRRVDRAHPGDLPGGEILGRTDYRQRERNQCRAHDDECDALADSRDSRRTAMIALLRHPNTRRSPRRSLEPTRLAGGRADAALLLGERTNGHSEHAGRRVPLTFRSASWRPPHALPRARGARHDAGGAPRRPRVAQAARVPARASPSLARTGPCARPRRFDGGARGSSREAISPEQLGLSKTCTRVDWGDGADARADGDADATLDHLSERVVRLSATRAALSSLGCSPAPRISTDGASSSGVPTTRLPRYSGVAASATSTFSSASSAPNTPSSASARARYRSRRRGGSTASASRARWWHLLRRPTPREANIGADPRIAVPPGAARTSTATSPNGAPPDALSREPHPLHSAPHLLHSVPSPFPWRTRPRPVGCLVVFVFAWRNFRARTTSAARFDSRVS